MADEKDVAVVETSMANPKQAVNVLENIEKVSAELTPVNTLQNNAPLFKQEENNEFFNSDAWSDFKTDMFRAYNSKRYPGFAAIETTADNPAYSTIINRYGKAIANRAQAMHSTYAKANSWIGRISDAYNSQRYGLRAAAARKDLSNAIRDGDEAEVARAKMLYQSEQRKSYEEGVEFDDYGNTLMSLAASTARNPATLLVEGVGVAAAPVTAGWSLAAANAINAAIVGADTYKVESGSALQSLDENAPEMTEQQKFEKARVVGGINAAVEAGLFAVGGNITGRGLQKVGKEAAIGAMKQAVKKKTGEEISRDAAKQMIKTDFIKALQNPAKEKAFKDTVAGLAWDVAKGAPGEGWQEVFQNSVTDAMLRSVKNGTTLTDEMLDDWADFITNPFDERHADKWETFINVTAASMVLGGGYTAAGTGVRKLGSLTSADTRHDGTGTIQDKALGAYNNSLGLSKLFNWHQNGDAKNALGASNAVLEEQIKRGEVSGKLYTTAEQVQEMQQDPEIAAALEEMGIATSLSESAENGGVVEIDLLAYDRVVNESQNTTLFQKMRNYLSFSDTTMSLNEFNQFINSKGKELASLITDEVRNDEESVYNRLKNMAIKAGRTAERAEGYAVMGHVLLNNLQALTKGEKNDILDRLTLTVDQGNGQILTENFGTKQEATKPTTTGKEAYREQDKKDVARIMANAKPVTVDQIKQDFQTVVAQSDKAREQLYATGDNSGFAKNTQHIYVAQAGDGTWYWRVTPTGRFEQINKYSNNNLYSQAGAGYSDDVNRLDDIVSKIPDIKFFEVPVEEFETLSNEFLTRDHPEMADVPVGQMVNEVFTENLEDGTTYEGDTINIDGKERSVYNSNGDRIANSEKALRAFYKWFGDSKVVDKQGRPLVVYHGTDAKFDTFDKTKVGKNASKLGGGFYTTNVKREAGGYGEPMALYALIQKPIQVTNFSHNITTEQRQQLYTYLKPYLGVSKFRDNSTIGDDESFLHDLYFDLDHEVRYEKFYEGLKNVLGADGVINTLKGTDGVQEFIVPTSNQMKSTDNLGTFDGSDGNVYHMFVGSRTQDVADRIADTLGKRKELDEARAIEKASVDKGKEPDYEAIWEKTGWYKEPDTSWSYEIADNDADYDIDKIKNKSGKLKANVTLTVGDVLDHPALYDLFPELKQMPLIMGNRRTSSKMGGYSPTYKNITLYPKALEDDVRSYKDIDEVVKETLVHEVQHAVQDKFNFMRFNFGGSRGIQNDRITEDKQKELRTLYDLQSDVVTMAIDSGKLPNVNRMSNVREVFSYRNELLTLAKGDAKKEQTVKDFVDQFIKTKEYNFDWKVSYIRRSQEVHARNTERRLHLTAEQRRQISPSATLDVAGSVQVGGAPTWSDLPHQIRELRVLKFAGVPVEPTKQEQIEAGRATARNGKYEIRLAPEANAVTFAHELFHVFSLEMQRVYNEGTITDYWRKQADKMFKIAGAEPQVDPADPTVVRYFLTEAQEEHLANMFTTYIMKGKIENQEVRGLLSKLIDLFKTTYRQLEGAGLTPMALDAKALDFFNTVMSTQDAIEEIQRNAGLLEILPPESVDRELYDYYIANLAVSKVEASNDLRRKLYAIDTFKNGAEYTKKMQEFKDNAKAELLEDDKYKVLAQASLYPEDKAQQTLLWAEKNIPEANFTLGDITDILENTPSLEEASTRAAEEEMDKYLAKRFNLTPQDVGFKEERNRAKVRALLAESVMQRGGTIDDIEAEIRKADAASDKHLGKTSVYQIMDLGKWKNREAAAVERYAWAKSEGRKDLMSAERYNQAVLNLIMIKSAGFKNEYQKLTALFDKLQSRQRKYRRKDEFGNEYGEYEHRYHAQDWELLRSISENFGNKIRDGRRSMKPVHQQMKEWIQTQVENRFTTVAGLEDFIPFIDKGTDGSIGAMKGKDFKKLWAVMHTIDSIAMREQQLYLDGQYADMNKYIEQTLQFHSEKDIKTDEDKGDWYHKYFGRYGTWQNPEPLLRAIFPPEVFQKIFLPMFNGALKSEAQAKQWIERWKRAKAKINTSNEVFALDDGTQITYGETNKKTMTYGDVANLLIAMGAEHSYENYKLKFGLSDEQAEQIASQAIKRNAKYVEFMNETWNVYGEATELLNNSFQERTNELFVRKEHRAFTIDGIKFEGGYVPEDKHYLALVRELGTWNQGIHNKVENKNEKLITKLADGDILSIIDITETKLSQSAKWAYAAIPYNNVKKFVEKKEVSDVIGERAFNFIRDWLQNWDTPHVDESGVWRPLTRVTTIAALGMRASTALLQVSGLAQAMAHLGPTYLARGMLQFVREGGFFHPFKGPRDKSLYMATRVEDPFAARFGTESQGRSFREIFESYNAKSGLGKIGVGLLSAYQTLAMMGIQIIDGWVATITWNGAYRRALDQGMTTEQAKAEADSVVRVTQSDATQISRSSAMQEPWARSVTAFATWTMAMRSQVVALSSSKSYRKDMVMWLATYAVMSSFIEAFLKEMTEPADEGEEDKEMLERIMNSWYNKIVEAVGTQVMPFAGAGAAGAKMLAGALVNTDDEKIFKVFAGGSVPALQYASRAVQAGAQSIKYMRSGEEEDRDKMLIQSAGLVSYELKKRVKQALED